MTDEDFIKVLKALAHPVRLRIMRALSDAERSVGEIEEAAGITQPTLSQQLAVLRQAGLVGTRKEAKLVYYRLDETVLLHASSVLAKVSGQALEPVQSDPPRRSVPGVANFARLA